MKFEMKEQDIMKLMQKPLPPPTPLAKTIIRCEQEGTTMYISNRKETREQRDFSLVKKQFDIVGVLGAGSYGKTYEAIDKLRFFKHFALKRTRTHRNQSLQEARLLLELQNPCIISIFSCWQEQDSLYVEMSLGNMNLQEILDNYVQLPEDMFWAIAQDISYALEECHKKGIAHLDVKPSNVLVTHRNYFSTEKQQSSHALIFDNNNIDNQTPNQINYEFLRMSNVHDYMTPRNQSARASPHLKDYQFVLSDESFKYSDDKWSNNQSFSHSESLNNDVTLSDDETNDLQVKQLPKLQTQQTVKYEAPLSRLSCSSLSELQQKCIFQLIDFGQAQKSKNGEFPPECTCGDSAYVDYKFMQTSRPTFFSDLTSFALMLLELITGIKLPLQGPLFEKLRKQQWYDCFKDDMFGTNLQDIIEYRDDELKNATVQIDIVVWRSIGDLLTGKVQTIFEWREKYKEQLNQTNRSAIYSDVNSMNEKLFSISDSQLINRCIVLSKELMKSLKNRKKQKKNTQHKKHKRKVQFNKQEKLKLIQSEIQSVKQFIAKGGRYMNANKHSIIKQNMLDSVTMLQSNVSKSKGLQGSKSNNKDVDEFFDDHNSPGYFNSMPVQTNPGNTTNVLTDMAFTLDDGNDQLFFHEEEGQEMNSFVHLSNRCSDEENNNTPYDPLDDNVFFDDNVNSSKNTVNMLESGENNSIIRMNNETGPTLIIDALKHDNSIEQIKSSDQISLSSETQLKNNDKNDIQKINVTTNVNNFFISRQKDDTFNDKQELSNKSTSEISLESKQAQPYTKYEDISNENRLPDDVINTNENNFALSQAKKEHSDEEYTDEYSTTTDKQNINQTFNNIFIKSTLPQVCSKILSFMENTSGIWQMVYYKNINYQTPTTKNDILTLSSKRSSQEQCDDHAADNDNQAKQSQQHIEHSDMMRLNATGRIKPKSNNINILTKQELDQWGYTTPNQGKVIQKFEKKQSPLFYNPINLQRYMIYFMFCLIFILLSYLLKLFKVMHMLQPYQILLKVSWVLFALSFGGMIKLFYDMNTQSTNMSHHSPYVRVFGDVYINKAMFTQAMFGYFLPIVLYLIHWIVFISLKGNVSYSFYIAILAEAVVLYLCGKYIK